MSAKDKIKDCSRTCLQPITVHITHLTRFPREVVVTFLFMMIVHSSCVVGNIVNSTELVIDMVYRIIIQITCSVSHILVGVLHEI